jgi:hypothetical protein
MKKIILSAISALVIGSVIFISCKPKNDSDAITPGYKDEVTGTGGNPNITNVTTTGTISTTSTAMQNSQLTGIGTVGVWSNVNCSTPAPTCLTTSNSSLGTTITICFSTAPTAGTYQLVSSSSLLGPGKAFMTVQNPPQQPTGSTWYSASGSVIVTISGSSITGSFTNVSCLQSGSNFPVVTVDGQVGCL